MGDTSYILVAYVLGGLVALIGGIKAIDWLIGQKYMTKECCISYKNDLEKQIINNKIDLSEKVETQYKDILKKIDRQTEIFQGLAKSVAEISAENKIILRQFENINKEK